MYGVEYAIFHISLRPIRAISSVGLEHLPYKQGVTGSNPVVPTKHESCDTQVSWDFLLVADINK